jgi:PAS domain S-box-containing protein
MPPTQSRVHSPTSAFLRRNQAVLSIGLILAVLAVTLTAVLAVRHFHQEAEARVAVTTQNMALSLDQTIEGGIVVGLAALFILASAAFAWAVTHYVALKTDISERKRIEQALRAESEKNLALLRNASDGIHILDRDGNVIEASDSFCAMLGYAREEVIGMNVAQWDAGFNPDELRQVVARQFEQPVRAQFETHHRRKDGSVFAVEVSGYPLELDGRPVLFNSSRDISARKQTEALLRDSEQRFRLFFERNSSVMLLIEPGSGEIIAANAAAAAYYGYPQANLVGMSINQINTLPPDRIHAERQKALHEDRTYFLFPHRLASGEVRDVEVHSTPIQDGGRDLLLSIVHDITERKQARQQLERVLAEQKAMLENELIGIVKVKNRVVVWANPAFEQMLGYAPGELNGAPTRQNYPSAAAYEAFGAAAYPVLSAGKIYRTRFEHMHKDGQPIWLEVSGAMLNPAQGESLWGFVDVTERKAAETQLQLAASVFRHAREGIIITNTDGAIIDVNAAFTRITGYSHDEVLGRNPRLLSSGRHDPCVLRSHVARPERERLLVRRNLEPAQERRGVRRIANHQRRARCR